MSTALEEPRTHSSTSATHRLRATMAAVRLSLTWLGTRKSLTAEQKSQAADTFGAESTFVSAGKKLLDTKHPAFKAVTSVKTRAVNYWKGITLPFPEPGIRLIRQSDIEGFDRQLTDLQYELAAAVKELEACYDELKATARRRLGRLFNAADYPDSLSGLFAIEWDFPSVEPPEYLRQLNPELYEQEQQRVTARFDEAVQLAEAAFMDELANLISHLTERITGQVDGKPKVFRDSAVTNLAEFFERFRTLNIRSNEQLDELVAQAQRIVQGVEPQKLRDSRQLRQHIARELSQVQSALDGLLVDRPRRNILRKPQ